MPIPVIDWCKSQWQRILSIFGRGHAGVDRDDLDPEIREVFFAELDDVTDALNQAYAIWRVNSADQAAMKNLRRGFHTLKGSALIVGASVLGEFCGRFEQLIIKMNDQHASITPDVIATVGQAIDLLPAFAKATRTGRAPPASARSIGNKAQRLLG